MCSKLQRMNYVSTVVVDALYCVHYITPMIPENVNAPFQIKIVTRTGHRNNKKL